MKANKDLIQIGDTVIFNCDEYRNGEVSQFDGEVLSVTDEGVDVLYLSGYRSRNDFIEFDAVIAKLDESKPFIKLANAPFSGKFDEFV